MMIDNPMIRHHSHGGMTRQMRITPMISNTMPSTLLFLPNPCINMIPTPCYIILIMELVCYYFFFGDEHSNYREICEMDVCAVRLAVLLVYFTKAIPSSYNR